MSALLGVNVDHVATLRQARQGRIPNPFELAQLAVKGGADSIVVHLREDRRHIQDSDVAALKKKLNVPLDLEMAAVPEIIRFAVRLKPHWCCLVPERREELTTEGGLAVARDQKRLSGAIKKLKSAGIHVSLFIEPRAHDIRLSKKMGADAVELHTGLYAGASPGSRAGKIESLNLSARLSGELGLIVNAGHGLDYGNVGVAAAIPGIHALNIGFSIISQALQVGMERAVREMKQLIKRTRS